MSMCGCGNEHVAGCPEAADENHTPAPAGLVDRLPLSEHESCPKCRGRFETVKPVNDKCPWCEPADKGKPAGGVEDGAWDYVREQEVNFLSWIKKLPAEKLNEIYAITALAYTHGFDDAQARADEDLDRKIEEAMKRAEIDGRLRTYDGALTEMQDKLARANEVIAAMEHGLKFYVHAAPYGWAQAEFRAHAEHALKLLKAYREESK